MDKHEEQAPPVQGSSARRAAVELLAKEGERLDRSEAEVLHCIRILGEGPEGDVPMTSSDVVRCVIERNGDLKPGLIYGSLLHLRDTKVIRLNDLTEEVQMVGAAGKSSA